MFCSYAGFLKVWFRYQNNLTKCNLYKLKRGMSRNVEIKAKIYDFPAFLQRVGEVTDKPVTVLRQIDTYFKVPEGRLKMRVIEADRAELIYYNRPDREGPKLSNYHKQQFSNIEEAEGLKTLLIGCLGLVGEVTKERHLFMYDHTRIHVDSVKDLGYFMELEVMLNEDQTTDQGISIAEDLMAQLGVKKEDLISGSYINLLTSKS